MNESELAEMLWRIYRDAPKGERVTVSLLFGIKYAAELEGRMNKEFVRRAGLPANYASEIRKGMNLSKYVDLNDCAEGHRGSIPRD